MAGKRKNPVEEIPVSDEPLKPGRLNLKQEQFCLEYCKDFNATQAAIRAGYSKKTAYSIGPELLKKIEIIRRLQELLAERKSVDREWIIDKLVTNVRRGLQEVPVLDKQGNPTGEYRYQAQAVNRALELLGRTEGMFSETVEVRDTTPRLSPADLVAQFLERAPAVMRIVAGQQALPGIEVAFTEVLQPATPTLDEKTDENDE